jgi:hypothetical protein
MNVKTKKALRSLALTLAISSCATAAFAANKKKPYMIYENNPASMTVLWQDDATESNVISWGTDTSYALGSATISEYGTDHQHKYQIPGLDPATKYFYKVEATAGGTLYGAGSFTTAPATSANAVKFLAYGDTRSQPFVMDAVVREMRMVDPSFKTIAIQAGDWVVNDNDTYWGSSTGTPSGTTNEWFNNNAETQGFLSEIPVNGVKGNHEQSGGISGYSKYFPKYYPFPYQFATENATNPGYFNKLYWSFDYGPVHFTVVDQYTTPYTVGSDQYNWLVNDLRTTTKPWKVLLYHEPAWTAGTGHTNLIINQQVFDPIIRQYGVDVVYAGHVHNYSRVQVNNMTEAATNTQTVGVADSIVPTVPYITNGGGGAGLTSIDGHTTVPGIYGTGLGVDGDPSRFNQGSCPTPGSANCFRHVVAASGHYSYMTFDVNDKTLTMRAYKVTKAGNGPLNLTSLNTDTASTLVDTVVLTHPTDISSEFNVTTTGFVYSRTTGKYSGTMTVTNTSPSTISIPLNVLLNNLTPGVTMVNAAGSYNGFPYAAPAVQDIAPGASVSIPLQFSNPSYAKITFTPVVYRQFN